VRGGIALFGLRWLFTLVVGVPAFFVAVHTIGETGGREPFFTNASHPMPLIELSLWINQLPATVGAALLGSALLGWFGNTFLTAGAVRVLDQDSSEQPGVWQAVFSWGPRALLPYWRVALFIVAMLAASVLILARSSDRVLDHAALAGWTAKADLVGIVLVRGLLQAACVAVLGACAFWTNVIIVADDRRYVRRLLTIVPRIATRRPINALALHVVSGSAAVLVGGVVLATWAQSQRLAPAMWMCIWAMALGVQSWIWMWRVRVCLLTWRTSAFDDLRRIPDGPWHAFRRARSKLAERYWKRFADEG
jgi:hypothetical protein